MSGGVSSREPAFAELLDYWFDEVGPEEASALEEHVFDCGRCSGRLEQIAALADGVERIASTGGVGAVMTGTFVERLKRNGIRVREYHLQPSASVFCTIAPEDDLVVARLAAPLEGIGRLDLVLHGPDPSSVRLEDVPFDAVAGEVVVAPEAAALRRLGTATQRIELLAIDGARERVLADYTFNHRPYTAGA